MSYLSEDAKKRIEEIKNAKEISTKRAPIKGYLFSDIIQDNLFALTKNQKSCFRAIDGVITDEAMEIFNDKVVVNSFIGCLFDEVDAELKGRKLHEFSGNQFTKVMSKILLNFIDCMSKGTLKITDDEFYVFSSGKVAKMVLADENGEPVGIEIIPNEDGTATVADFNLGVKSEHASVEAAQDFVETLL